MDKWRKAEFTTITQSNDQAFTGQSALAVQTTAISNALYAMRTQDFSADMIVGQVYWPAQEGIDLDWVQVCVGEEGKCVSIPENANQWNTFSTWRTERITVNRSMLRSWRRYIFREISKVQKISPTPSTLILFKFTTPGSPERGVLTVDPAWELKPGSVAKKYWEQFLAKKYEWSSIDGEVTHKPNAVLVSRRDNENVGRII